MPDIEGQQNQGDDIPEGSFIPESKDEDRLIKTSLSRTIFWLPVGISIALVTILGGYLLYSYRSLQLKLLAGLPVSSINPLYINLLITTILLSVLLLSLSALVFWSAASRITQPLQNLINSLNQFKTGDWQKRSSIKRSDEIGLLATLFNYIAGELSVLYKNMDGQVKERTRQLKTASEVAQIVSSTNDISDLFLRTCNLVIERFNCYNASIYLLDETSNSISLIQTSGPIPNQINRKNYRLPVNSQSLVGWVSYTNQARLVSDTSAYPFLDSDNLLPEIQSEAAIPISSGNKVLGVLHIQSDIKNTFNLDNTSVFQTLANQLATAFQNIQHIQTAEDTIQGTSLLYESSYQIVTAITEADIFQIVARTLQQTPYQSALLSIEYDRLHFISLYNPLTKEQVDASQWDNIHTPEIIPLFQPSKPLFIQELNKAPEALMGLVLPLRTIGGQSAVLIPVFCSDLFSGLLMIAARDKTFLTPTRIQTFSRLSDIMGIAIDKLRRMDQIETRVLGLKAAADIGVNVSLETDLQHLYKTVHSQILNLMGPVEFMIGLFQPDTGLIEVPYIYENGQPISLEPFPLGQGLTSILIKEKKPLLLVDNVEQEALALGAKNIGAPAKSWLGVPLMIGDQVIGVMIVQDLERERRFSEKDIELLDTFVPQLTVSIRMAQTINQLEKSAQQLETASEIARDVSGDLQVEQLLPHVVNLVKDRFGFYHASIFILDPTGSYAILRESTGEAGAQMKLAGHKLAVGSKSIVGQTALKGSPVVINDVRQDASYLPNPLLPATKSEVGIPMKSGNRILGVLDVQSTSLKAFSEDDVRILSILADQLTTAIINAELFDETQLHLQQQRDIHQITVAAASSPNVSEALDKVVKGLSVLLQNARVSIFLVNPRDDMLDITASVGYENTPELSTFKIRLGEGVVGQAGKERRLINIPNVKNELHYIAVDPLVCSELAIPLIFQDQLIGVINLESDQIDAFKDETQEMMGAIISSLTGIIANTQLVAQNRLQMDREKQLYTLTNKIRQAFDIETILEISATEIGQILNAKKVKLEIGNRSTSRPEVPEPASNKNGGTNN